MTTESPPIRDNLIEDDTGAISMPWILFFNQTFNGDSGAAWTPTFTDLTESGTPTITGRYYQLSKYVTYFNIIVTPGTNTSAVAGTTYVDNFPLTAYSNGICGTVSNRLGGSLGMVEATSNRIYVPAWTTLTTPVNIIGIVEAT